MPEGLPLRSRTRRNRLILVMTRERVLTLDTVADVKAEACKLYRAVRAKEIDASEAGKLAYLLQIIAKLAETADLEQKLLELEARS